MAGKRIFYPVFNYSIDAITQNTDFLGAVFLCAAQLLVKSMKLEAAQQSLSIILL